MSAIKDLMTVHDYCSCFNLSTLHPLVSAVDLSEGTWSVQESTTAVRYHFYALFLKRGRNCILQYGRQHYDYQDGTLVFVGPGQVVDVSSIDFLTPPAGYEILFHPDLLRSTHLGTIMAQYSFFFYALHEALHLSAKERQIILDCFDNIHYELNQGIDKHSKTVIVSNLELLLNYCNRFYDRQFITRDTANLNIIVKFETSLRHYIQSGKARELGPPSVRYFAEELSLSPNYFGDLVKKETGRSAQEYLLVKIIELAKEKIFDPDKSVSEIAYELGFKYSQHFSRMFKKETGFTPSEYRTLT